MYLIILFFIFRDTSCVVRETVLLELKLWIQIDSIYFLNDFWMYIYWALGDRSFAIQIIALEVYTYFFMLCLFHKLFCFVY